MIGALLATVAHLWGEGLQGPSSVTIQPDPAGYAVIFSNELVASVSVVPFELAIDGLTVEGVVVSEDAEIADEMTVNPPPGFYCSPCSVVVNEGDTGTVLLQPQLLGFLE